jgi:hypothetical protein
MREGLFVRQDVSALSNSAGQRAAALPARLADGLGLESTLVHFWTCAPGAVSGRPCWVPRSAPGSARFGLCCPNSTSAYLHDKRGGTSFFIFSFAHQLPRFALCLRGQAAANARTSHNCLSFSLLCQADGVVCRGGSPQIDCIALGRAHAPHGPPTLRSHSLFE